MTLRIPVIKYPGDNATLKFPQVVITVDQDGEYTAPGTGGGSGGTTPTGSAGSPNAAVVSVQGIAGGTAQAVADAIADAALGAPSDTAGANTVVGKLKELVNTFKTAIAVTINGALPAGTNRIGDAGSIQVGNWFESPFQPIPAATSGLTAGPTATSTPLALGTYTASTYRIRNAASSASPVAWRLNTATPGTAAVMPVAASTAGTGGTVGDKSLDPGGVEVFTLTAAQQTALAAGTLYLSAVTAAGGSGTIFVTPGVAGR